MSSPSFRTAGNLLNPEGKDMTFSIVGVCQTTGQIGVAISSSSIAVGARCPWLSAGVGAVSTQNITLPSLGQDILALMAAGMPPEAAADKALEADEWREYRQVVVIDRQARTSAFTGSGALGVHHFSEGRNCVAAG